MLEAAAVLNLQSLALAAAEEEEAAEEQALFAQEALEISIFVLGEVSSRRGALSCPRFSTYIPRRASNLQYRPTLAVLSEW